MAQKDIQQALNAMGPQIARYMLARAAFGDYDAAKTLLPYVVPKASRSAAPLSDVVQIDISTTAAAKDTLTRIAAAIGECRIGKEEGIELMDVVGRAMERMGVADVQELTKRIEELENAPAVSTASNSRVPISHANGSTPVWGNIEKHPSVK